MRTIKAGVIGSGFSGLAHVEALRRLPRVEVVALAEAGRELAEEKADELGIPRAYGDLHGLLCDDEVEVVHNCTPNRLHFEINQAVLLAGKHLVSEKPLSLTRQESAELLALADKRGLKHAVCFNYACYPMVRQCRAMVERGELGRVNLIHGSYLQDWLAFATDYNWRIEPDVGGRSRAVADIGSHWCATVQAATGLSITQVFADLATVIPTRTRPMGRTITFSGPAAANARSSEEVPVTTEDYATVLIKLSNGGRGAFTVSQVSHGCKNRLLFRVDGAQASVEWNQETPDVLVVGRRSEPNGQFLRDPSLVYPEVRAYVSYPGGHPEGWADGLKNVLKAFYQDVRGESHPWYPTFSEGHYEMLIVDAVLESAARGEWVKVG